MKPESFIINMIRKWINHTKEGARRTKDDLIKFDEFWSFIISHIIEFQDHLDKELSDFSKMVRYDGSIVRIHQRFDKNKEFYGVQELKHRVSWTKSNNLQDIYWIYPNNKYLKMTAQTSPDVFGIDLTGLESYIRKYWSENNDFQFISPAITKEQEVVFPLEFQYINKFEIVEFESPY